MGGATAISMNTALTKFWITILILTVLRSDLIIGSYGKVLIHKSTDMELINSGAQSNTVVKNSFRPLPFPVSFRFYDRNRDGYINLQELKTITGEAENLELAFRASDLNGDGWVSPREYKEVPWGYNRQRDRVLHDRA